MLLSVIIVVALAARVLLDLTGIAKPDWRLDLGYVALFAVVAAALLTQDFKDPFGYVSLLVSGFWGVRAIVAAKRRRAAPSN
jgi:hypothetical protein